MTFFQDIYDKLFSQKPLKNGIISQEPLKRKAKEKEKFQSWFASREHKALLDDIHRSSYKA